MIPSATTLMAKIICINDYQVKRDLKYTETGLFDKLSQIKAVMILFFLFCQGNFKNQLNSSRQSS